ncbi:MAG: rhomboid family intramembrane serine protease, partial [Planctomycetota bacterium]
MFLPIRTDYRLRHTPWVNYGLLAANILIFLLGFNTTTAENYRQTMPWMLHADWPQVYQFFSSMFLHADWRHLGGNMLFLWVFGNALNDRFGHVGYLSFYLAGGLLAGLGYLALTPSGQLLGASGAISAVTGAFLVLLPKTRVTLIAFLFVIVPFEVSSLFFLAFQFVFNMW